MIQEITSKEIFKANQVLTLAIAKTLIGKKLAITSPEYYGNCPSVRVFILDDIKSEWVIAANVPCEGYASQQDYFSKKLTIRKEVFKNNLKLVGTGDTPYATCDLKDYYTFKEPTFFGSDSDREIYFIKLEQETH